METLSVITPALLAKGCAQLNELERVLAQCPPPPVQPVTNRFTPGLYSREIRMQAGLVCTSKIHKTHHQFIVSKGVCEVWSEDDGWQLIRAPYHGITKPGARRAFKIIEDTIFTLFWPNPDNLTDLAAIEDAMIESHEIPKQGEL